MEKDSGGIQVIARAAAILRAVRREGVSLGALAKQTGLPRSTVQRIVDALAAEHFVEAGEAGVRLGWGLNQLVQLTRSDVVLHARPHLEALAQATRETVDVAGRHGREVAFLDCIMSDQELRVVIGTDKVRPLHVMANGKALLAGMTDAEVTRLLDGRLEPLTPHSLTSMPALLAQLATIRSSGFSYDLEEHALGVCAVGATIRVPGMAAHAVSVAVPASRFEASLPALRQAVQQARSDIEAALGALAPQAL